MDEERDSRARRMSAQELRMEMVGKHISFEDAVAWAGIPKVMAALGMEPMGDVVPAHKDTKRDEYRITLDDPARMETI